MASAADTDYLLLLALVQGLTEYLPISSSGHLALLGIVYHGVAHPLWLDIAVHGGTLLAGLVFFRRDLGMMARHAWHRPNSADGREIVYLVIATLPALLVGGLLFVGGFAPLFTHPAAIGLTSMVFALLLAAALWQRRPVRTLTQRRAWLIGFVQCCAFLPGASRTGVALTGALAVGLSHAAALRFALLLGLPTIGGAAMLAAYDLAQAGERESLMLALSAALLAFFAGLAVLALFVRLLPHSALWWFIAYRLLLGGVLLVLF